ncbi:MAG: hypothetical protein AAFY00_01700, partial [Bacteroidota bacterium]
INVSTTVGQLRIVNLNENNQQEIYQGTWPNVTVVDVGPTYTEALDNLSDPAHNFESEIDTLITF